MIALLFQIDSIRLGILQSSGSLKMFRGRSCSVALLNTALGAEKTVFFNDANILKKR